MAPITISPRYQGDPHGTARLQFYLVQVRISRRHGVGSQPKRLQPFVQVADPVRGKAADHKRPCPLARLGWPDWNTEGRGVRLGKQLEHFVMGVETIIGSEKAWP